ncbi:MAG: 1,4-dihydroxy-2-naphthoate octaprenyltransferase [Candidatus Marinimicrobia bacterium]|nr:1,4-dihydroxy-2-naphthoate octaprenyltransferase [Candidatus Neomarinimicrobiota bacterium]
MIKHWITAFRLRTLPLAFSCIIMGSALANYYGVFRFTIFILALLTTLSLQILANLANDYGDTQHGVDDDARIGPDRVMQQGLLSTKQMQTAMWIFVGFSSICGVSLIIVGVGEKLYSSGLIMAFLGLGAIAAAVKYTMGKNPYGYAGLGDVFVFLFFGLIGVSGTFYLHGLFLPGQILLPATTIGLLSVGVLNINNMRDREQDKIHGKYTLVVKIGSKNARIYHIIIIVLSAIILTWFTWEFIIAGYRFFFFVIYPIILFQSIRIAKTKNDAALDPHLKVLALSTFLLSVLYWISLVL